MLERDAGAKATASIPTKHTSASSMDPAIVCGCPKLGLRYRVQSNSRLCATTRAYGCGRDSSLATTTLIACSAQVIVLHLEQRWRAHSLIVFQGLKALHREFRDTIYNQTKARIRHER